MRSARPTRALPGQPAVAVRSSANAEDLPGLSFAGQQETFLNVRGADAVLQAVKDCWASLWTTQAISYRHQNGIDPDAVAMAVVVQIMVPSEVSGILFTANPATGERGEMIVNASFGLGEAVVGGQVTPDTYVVDRATLTAKETMIGPKEQQIVANGELGVRLEDVAEDVRQRASLSEDMLAGLAETALGIEELFDGLPQDIEWAFSDGRLHVLQSRPITNLPVQPIEVEWVPTPPAKYLSRRQIVENMPDPICPLFEELYLTEGLESSRGGKSLMVGGGPLFVTLNGYAYQRFDWPQFFTKGADEKPKAIADADLDKAEYDAAMKAQERERQALLAKHKAQQRKQAEHDVGLFAETLSADDRVMFEAWMASQDRDGIAQAVTMPESDNPTFMAFNNTATNDRQLKEWHEVTRPRLVGIRDKWANVDPATASDAELLEGIREMAIEEGYYWSSNASHTFGVAKSTDDQFQCFLRESLPDHHFISGQFLSGIESKTMQANADMFEIAKLVRANADLATLVIVTPAKFLMDAMKARNDSREALDAIDEYLAAYGHQGYSMDFIEPTQVEDPSALFATLKAMVADDDYDPKDQEIRAANVRREKFADVSDLLDGLPYWQFRFRMWLARRYNYIREEVAFHFGYTWSVLRPMAYELGSRLVAAGTFKRPDDVYFLVTGRAEPRHRGARTGCRGGRTRRRGCHSPRTTRGPQAPPPAGHGSRRSEPDQGDRVQGNADQERRVERHDARFRGEFGPGDRSGKRDPGPHGIRQDGTRLDPGQSPDDACMDATVRPRSRPCDRHGQHPGPRLDRGARVRHPGRARRRQWHRAHQARPDVDDRRRCGNRSDPRLGASPSGDAMENASRSPGAGA